MAVTERAVVTALPAGMASPEVAERVVGDPGVSLVMVTAFVTPRIDVGALDVPVRDLGPFSVWPNAVEAWDLGVVVDGNAVQTFRHPNPPRPDPELWERLFAPVVVRTRIFEDLSKKGLLTCPVSEVDRLVGALYAGMSGPALPPEGALAAIEHAHDRGNWIRDIEAVELPGVVPGLQKELGAATGATRDGLALGLASRFYRRPEADRPKPDGVPLADHLKALEAKEPDYDFHAVCAAMGDYPLLLRALGLAVDLLIDARELQARGWVMIQPAVGQGPDELLDSAANLPHTRYLHDDGIFVADDRDASPDPGIRRGMLDLRFHRLTTLDVDSAGPQVAQVLANAAHRQQVLVSENGKGRHNDPSSLPALRTGGITVMRPGRYDVLRESLGRSAKHEGVVTTTDVPPELWSDDVTRGWRVDVLDRDSATLSDWLSLGERMGRYVFDGTPLALDGKEFEAYVKSASASTDTVKPVVLYTSEAVTGWDGWSLAAPRPGRVITPAGVEEPPESTMGGFPLSVTFTPAPNSLPVLRYGRVYQVRIRTADLAGNSHTLRGAPDGYESDPVVMTRWEPVLPPEVVPSRPFTEGESLLRVVLRSTRGVTPDDYVALDRVTGLPGHPATSASGADWRYQAVAARHLLAPKSAQLQAERHGGFDAAFAGNPAALWPLLQREEATFYDLPGAVLVEQGDPEVVVAPPATRGGELGPHRYLTSPNRPLVAPYLPDHLAQNVVIHDLPGYPVHAPLQVGLETPADRWPDYRTAALEVVEGPLGATADPGTGVVTVSLPKAEVRTIRLSSLFGPSSLPLMAVWERIRMAAAKGEPLTAPLAALEAAAKVARLWTLTPWTEMTLVHAVEMPLDDPALQLPLSRAHRVQGQTFASLAGRVVIHAKSTGRVDIDAHWLEPRDDIGKAPTIAPADWVPGAGHVADFNVRVDENVAVTGPQEGGGSHAVRHEFGDTKHRMVTYRTTATTRFRDYFPPAITDDPLLITTAADTLIDVPSSRRPDPPQVAYVVPIFGWDEASYDARRVGGMNWPPAFRRTRRGAGLRVYLRRPWWSSGEGERLAVVLPNQRGPLRITDLRVLLGGEADAADVDLVATTLSALLVDAGVQAATTAKLRRAIARTETTEGPEVHARLLSTLHASLTAAGIDVGLPTLERVWGQVGDRIGAGPGIFFPVSDLDEIQRSAFVTRWGRDPTAVAGNPGVSPRISDFLDRDGYATNLSLANPALERVAVATYEPAFDADRDLWFVDMHLGEHDHFMPFIRLALARYQKHSIPGCELSEVKVGDFMQLVPTREVTVRDFGDTTAHVTLRGRAGYGAVADAVSMSTTAQARAGHTLYVRAWVEQHRKSSPTDLDWEPATKDDTWLPLDRLDAGWMARWLARVPLPTPARGMAYRLAIEELQVHETDAQNVARDPSRFGYVTGIETRQVPVGLRLLWTDRIDLAVVDGRLVPESPARG